MRMSSLKRTRVSGKRLDIGPVRDLVERMVGQKLLPAVGIVVAPDANTSHFEDSGDDVHVEVEIQPTLLQVTCRLVAPGGAWRIPPVGEEVLVILPDGDLQFMPLAIPHLAAEVPSLLTEDDDVLDNRRGRQVVSASEDVALVPDGLVRLGSLAAPEAVVKGTTYRSAEDTFFAALVTFLGSLTALAAALAAPPAAAIGGAAQTAAGSVSGAATTFATAVATFNAAAASYLSAKTRTE